MTQSPDRRHLKFHSPATYRISVRGALGENWSERLGGMQIIREGEHEPITRLIGRLPDQAALMGVLETLYDLHLPMLNVEVVEDDDGEREPGEAAREKDASTGRGEE